ncbi:Ser/Thr protein kinase, putative [Babesia bigemina]|uniref:Ser/Thr protein kinase, putative n=1 Tax=Babesia bigemina TaxID=5866 RepID=A0A061CZX0_BABBI|nr:Ser/Thr protein kinase, putative [Babesia bigemina]CDR93963.1 Ser/Thr protein kinase, putative [Babesia bigemina]|eukprot:XP_012766149.1 Ser/Thr protein kinase, putative [Babesia bigemina]
MPREHPAQVADGEICLETPRADCRRESTYSAPLLDLAGRSSLHSYGFTIDDFDIGGIVGDGAHGQVFLARERRTGFICVIKCISKALLVQSKQEAIFKREIELHSHLRHPNIVSIYTWFDTESMVCIVLEYCFHGDLYTHLHQHKRLPEQRVAEILFEVTWAIRTCHDKHIAHLDIKPENILLDHNFSCKLADFGLSAHVGNGKGSISHMRGTYDYWSPEQAACKHNNRGKFGDFNHKSDIWALGVLAFELFFGFPPFGSTTQEPVNCVLERVQTHEWYRILVERHGRSRINEASPAFIRFCNMCFEKDAGRRADAATVLEHQWLRSRNAERYHSNMFVNQVRSYAAEYAGSV